MQLIKDKLATEACSETTIEGWFLFAIHLSDSFSYQVDMQAELVKNAIN